QRSTRTSRMAREPPSSRTASRSSRPTRRSAIGTPRRSSSRSPKRWRPMSPCDALSRLLEEALADDLGDLDGVERRPLAQVVGDDRQRKVVPDLWSDAEGADERRITPDALDRRHIAARLALVDDQTPRRLAKNLARLIVRDRIFELDVNRLRMANKDRHAHAG